MDDFWGAPAQESAQAAMQVDETSQQTTGYQYDVFVIGGGSGGISCARHAASYGKKVALADYVEPTPAGNKWGLGGTCVNVGCIPKKLMHYAGILAEARSDMALQGWNIDENEQGQWPVMVQNIQKHIKTLNWGFKADLIKSKVKYYNKYASFVDAHTLKLRAANGQEETVTAENIVVAVGGRPSYPDIPGAREFGITSDDVFSMVKPPGKTLVVGASYVALECAGFLSAFGFETTVMVRSILLRGFDQDMANLIGQYMSSSHTRFIQGATPSSLARAEEGGPITVTFNDAEGEKTEEFDTVLFAIGRYAVTAGLDLANAGVVAESNGKFKVNEQEQTNVANIYAVGDVLFGRLELTPVAIKTGQLLAKRLAGISTEVMDYDGVPTTVFTPLEYGCVGLTEEEANQRYGEENIDIFHTKFKPLEWELDKKAGSFKSKRMGYTKVIVHLADNNRVVGFHICAPNAGEITQGVAIGYKCGMTKEQMDSVVGIHPTCAEDCIGLDKTKRTDPDATKTGC